MMLRSVLTVLCLSLVIAGCAEQTPERGVRGVAPAGEARSLDAATLRFDGVYQSPLQRQQNIAYWDYLRFYPDGIVIIGASTGTPEEIKPWFERDRIMSGTGRPLPAVRYTIENGKLSFGFNLEGRQINFVATITVESLRIEDFKPAPGQAADPVLVFKPW